MNYSTINTESLNYYTSQENRNSGFDYIFHNQEDMNSYPFGFRPEYHNPSSYTHDMGIDYRPTTPNPYSSPCPPNETSYNGINNSKTPTMAHTNFINCCDSTTIPSTQQSPSIHPYFYSCPLTPPASPDYLPSSSSCDESDADIEENSEYHKEDNITTANTFLPESEDITMNTEESDIFMNQDNDGEKKGMVEEKVRINSFTSTHLHDPITSSTTSHSSTSTITTNKSSSISTSSSTPSHTRITIPMKTSSTSVHLDSSNPTPTSSFLSSTTTTNTSTSSSNSTTFYPITKDSLGLPFSFFNTNTNTRPICFPCRFSFTSSPSITSSKKSNSKTTTNNRRRSRTTSILLNNHTNSHTSLTTTTSRKRGYTEMCTNEGFGEDQGGPWSSCKCPDSLTLKNFDLDLFPKVRSAHEVLILSALAMKRMKLSRSSLHSPLSSSSFSNTPCQTRKRYDSTYSTKSSSFSTSHSTSWWNDIEEDEEEETPRIVEIS